jgi:hypothetical protein
VVLWGLALSYPARAVADETPQKQPLTEKPCYVSVIFSLTDEDSKQKAVIPLSSTPDFSE